MKAEPVLPASTRLVVVDTNVWISGALSNEGSPARTIRRVLDRGMPVFSAATFGELESRLWKPKFDRYVSVELRRRILHDLNAVAHWVEVPAGVAERKYCRDLDDDKFIHAAVAARAAWLVTGDQDLLVLPPIGGLRIVTPTDALLELTFCGEN